MMTTREQQETLVANAQAYFNRQYADADAFRIQLGPAVTLSHPEAYYGANNPDRRDVRLPEAVREACNLVKDDVDFSQYDADADGTVDCVILLTAGTDEQAGGGESAIWPQQGRLSNSGNALSLKGKRIDPYIAAPEGRLSMLCHEIGHVLGLPDFYDTDGEDSGGRTPGLWRTSLMDEGCFQDVPPDFGALEFDLLGLGRCEPLTVGRQILQPLQSSERRYLKAPTDKEGEYFLFECRAGALLVYHVDRSDNPAGHSPRHDADLTARERWEYGLVNDCASHPCARLLPADPEASDASALPFGLHGFDSFGSDTPTPFRSWSGHASTLALTDIHPTDDGNVAFEVIEPLALTDLTIYQDAAVLQWQPNPALTGILGFEVSWSDGDESGSQVLGPTATSFTIEGLHAQTTYLFSVRMDLSERNRYSVGGTFVTKVFHEGTYPYIYLSGALRNVDGSFPSGSQIPLRVFNATDVQEVIWTLDSMRIHPESDGLYTLRRSGLLRATILHTDGSSETIIKQITVQ